MPYPLTFFIGSAAFCDRSAESCGFHADRPRGRYTTVERSARQHRNHCTSRHCKARYTLPVLTGRKHGPWTRVSFWTRVLQVENNRAVIKNSACRSRRHACSRVSKNAARVYGPWTRPTAREDGKCVPGITLQAQLKHVQYRYNDTKASGVPIEFHLGI